MRGEIYTVNTTLVGSIDNLQNMTDKDFKFRQFLFFVLYIYDDHIRFRSNFGIGTTWQTMGWQIELLIDLRFSPKNLGIAD